MPLNNELQKTYDGLLEKYTREDLILLIAELKNKLETWERITDSDNWSDMAEVAKVLHAHDKKYKVYGRNTIFAILRDAKVLRYNNEPYQSYIDRGYFRQIEVEKDFGYKVAIIPKTIVSAKGIDYIRGIIDEINN